MKKVLLIDDEKDFCFCTKEALELTGSYKVFVANDGKKGMHAARWHGPDLILLDLVMPGIDGVEALERLKAEEKTRSIPVVILTALYNEGSKARTADLGAVDYIVKPVDMDVLDSRIRKALKAGSINGR